MYADVVAYSDIGEHRTGTPEDVRTSDWLAHELSGVGFDARLEPYTLQQFFIARAALSVGGRAFDAFPLWF